MPGARDGCLSGADFERLAGGDDPTPIEAEHIASCMRCRARAAEAESDASFLGRVRKLAGPSLAPDGAPRMPGYKILERINSGAQGVIYRAIQEATSRIVAIKVLGATTLTEGGSSRDRSRAEREAEIAARLRHPNVVSVFESRTLADGRIAMVMEYVDGVPMDTWRPDGATDQERLQMLLRTFATVCGAVHHAHLHGVIHRDIKPENVLVTPDARPVVLDFGVARADGLHTTRTGEFAGTPAYASPEQVSAKPDGVNALTDVYSLGVVLYYVLCGTLPYELYGSLFDIARIITEVEPVPLRQRVPSISPDLEAIVLRALRKNRTDRYQSAAGLAIDIERYLRGAPVEARSGSGWYVLRKAVVMNRARLAWAAAVSIVALAGAVGVGISLANTHQAEMQAKAQHDDAQAIAEFLREILPGSVQEDKPGTLEDSPVLDGFRRLHFRLETGDFADRPGVDQALRRIWGGVHSQLGEGRAVNLIPYAEISLRSGLERLRAEHPEPKAQIAATLHELAGVLRLRNRLWEAQTTCEQALAMRIELLGEQAHDTARTRLVLAQILADQHRWPEANEMVARGKNTLLALGTDDTELEIAAASVLQSKICFEQGLIAEAAPFVFDALTRRSRQLAPDDADILHLVTDAATIAADSPQAAVAEALSKVYGVKGSDLVVAVDADRRAIEATPAKMYGFTTPATNRGRTLALRRMVQLQTQFVGEDDASLTRGYLAVMNSAADEGLLDIRIDAALQAADLLERKFGRNDTRILVCLDQATVALALAGRADEAFDVVRRGLAIRETIPAEARDALVYANARRVGAWCLSLGGHPEQAIAESRIAIAELTKALHPDHYLVALAKSPLIVSLIELGKLDEAEAVSKEAIDAIEHSAAVSGDQKSHISFARGHALAAKGRFAEALPMLEQAWTLYYQFLPDEFPWRALCMNDAAISAQRVSDEKAQALWLSRSSSAASTSEAN